MHNSENSIQVFEELIACGKYNEAAELLEKLTANEPNNHQAWYYLSFAYSNLSRAEESEQAIRKAILIKDDEPTYLINLVYKLYAKEDRQAATELCNRIIKIDPAHYQTKRILGMLAKDAGDFGLAIKYFDQVLLQCDDVDTMLMLANTHVDLGELDQAGELFTKLGNMELTPEQLDEKNEYFIRFLLEKAMHGWTGEVTGDDGEKLYFPETIEQVEESERCLKMIKNLGPADSCYNDRFEQLKDSVAANRKKLKSTGPISSFDNWYGNLSDTNRHAYDSLEKLIDTWTGIQVTDGVEYRFPKTVKDIKESDRTLKLIGEIPFKDDRVKARYDELRGVVDYKMKGVPNFKWQFARALVFSLIAIAILYIGLQYSRFNAFEFTFNQDDWVVGESTELVYDAFVGDNGKDKKTYRTLSAGTKVTPIARKGRWWAQVKTDDGDLGYIYYRSLRGSKSMVANEVTPLLPDINAKTAKDSVSRGETVTVIGYYKKAKEERGSIVKVKTSSGKIGFVPHYRLDAPFMSNIPEISQAYIFPTTAENVESIIGKRVEDIAGKYGPVTSIITKAGKVKAFFNQLEFIKGDTKYSGVFFSLGGDGKVSGYEADRTTKVKFVSKLPLANQIRKAEPFDLVSFSFYESKDIKLSWWENFKAKGWFTKVLGWVVSFIIGFLVIFIFFSIPRLIVHPALILINHFKLLGNAMVLFLNFVIYGLVTYIFFVWMALLMNQFFLAALFSVLTFAFWWHFYRKKVNYNRCPSCHTMNVGLDLGSTYHGRSSSVSWGTYDVYKGTTETSTQIIRNYERRDVKTTNYTDHYTDHRECINCGHNWNISRDKSAGSVTRRY